MSCLVTPIDAQMREIGVKMAEPVPVARIEDRIDKETLKLLEGNGDARRGFKKLNKLFGEIEGNTERYDTPLLKGEEIEMGGKKFKLAEHIRLHYLD